MYYFIFFKKKVPSLPSLVAMWNNLDCWSLRNIAAIASWLLEIYHLFLIELEHFTTWCSGIQALPLYIYIWRKKMAELCSWCLWETKSLKVSFSQCLSKHILWLHQDISVMIPFWDKQWAGMQVLYSLFTITYFMLVENQDYIQIGI